VLVGGSALAIARGLAELAWLPVAVLTTVLAGIPAYSRERSCAHRYQQASVQPDIPQTSHRHLSSQYGRGR
jgi:hypothetical protein